LGIYRRDESDGREIMVWTYMEMEDLKYRRNTNIACVVAMTDGRRNNDVVGHTLKPPHASI